MCPCARPRVPCVLEITHRGRQVVLIVVETTGAVHPEHAIGMLYGWHAEARVEGCLDRTVYGTSRTATTSFFTHHLRLISLAAD